MGELTIASLCHILTNLTHNRCVYQEYSKVCRCSSDVMSPVTIPTIAAAPDIMFSEALLIFFVLAIWLSAIGFCLNQYKSLRRLETQVHYGVSRKDPLNIGDIKIVAREQDSIIYKKKRYSTVLDTHLSHDQLKTMSYVQQYLPKTLPGYEPSSTALNALVVKREDLTEGLRYPSTPVSMVPLSTHHEVAEEIPSTSPHSFVVVEANRNRLNGRMSYVHRTESARLSGGLTVPHTLTPSSLPSSWTGSRIYETSRSTQHLCVPSNSLRSNRHSDGNISFPIPPSAQPDLQSAGEKLIDPRRISSAVRRSLLALHRESQENVVMQRHKEKTQSENDVHGAFTPWKIKMKSKLKRTHHHQYPAVPSANHSRPHSNTLSILPLRTTTGDHERRISEYATFSQEYRFSTPPPRSYSPATAPSLRRSFKHNPKYSTQSTTESETTQTDMPMIASIYVSVDNEDVSKVAEPSLAPP